MGMQIIPQSGAKANADGVLIPQSDLTSYGLKPNDVTDDIQGMFRLLRAILRALGESDLSGVLGLSLAGLGQTSPAFGLVNTSCSFTFSFIVEATSRTGSLIPLPATGNNAGLGGLDLSSIFPSISKVNVNSTVSVPGLLIPTVDLLPFGNLSHPALNLSSGQDNRLWLEAFLLYLAEIVPVRTREQSSALVLKSAGIPGISQLPANATAALNPTTGLDPTKTYLCVSRIISFTLQSVISTDHTLEVNVVTS